MIFNYCIYGDILPSYTGDVTITVYDNTLTEIYSKTIFIENEYQFNLGDRDLFDINYKLRKGSTAIITVDNKFYKIKLSEDFLHNYDIDLDEIKIPTATTAEDFDDLLETFRIVTDKLVLREFDDNVYSYFEVINTSNLDIVYYSNEELNWIPREHGNYNILHRLYNSSNLEVSESIININIFENYIETMSIDYIYYSKRDKIIQIELPEYVLNTVILKDTFYIANNKLYGKLTNLKPIELLYSRGKIIVKPQIGDILDY